MCCKQKIIHGQQCTILWHVDDIKISHAEEQVVSEVLAELEIEYGKEALLTVSHESKHNYLGMLFDHTKVGAKSPCLNT